MVLALLGIAAVLPVLYLAVRTLTVAVGRLAGELGVGEGGAGLLAALAADGPEVASATVALLDGRGGTAQGVLVGASALNLLGVIAAPTLVRPGRCATAAPLAAAACFAALAGLLATAAGPPGKGVGAAACAVAFLLLLGEGRAPGSGRRRPTARTALLAGAAVGLLVGASWPLVLLAETVGR